MAIQKFIDTFLQPLLDKLSYENKNVILLGNFIIDLLHYELHIQTREFLDKIYFRSLTPHITIPTRITPHSRTLIDNIFTQGRIQALFEIGKPLLGIQKSASH